MPILLRSLPLIAVLQLGTALYAQEAEAPADEGTPAEEQSDQDDVSSELDLGRQVEEDLSYIKEQYGDWQLQCFRAETGEDPCQMYQLLREETGNPVAEFSIFKLPDSVQASAGATVIVPLGTLLTEGLTLSVDGGPLKAYNFAFCSMSGCFARIGFTQEDIDAFKAGAAAQLNIVPAQAPDQLVRINVSLDGFTAAFNEASVINN